MSKINKERIKELDRLRVVAENVILKGLSVKDTATLLNITVHFVNREINKIVYSILGKDSLHDFPHPFTLEKYPDAWHITKDETRFISGCLTIPQLRREKDFVMKEVRSYCEREKNLMINRARDSSFPQVFPEGISVKELKALIQQWPDADENNEPILLWMETAPEVLPLLTGSTSSHLS